MIRLRSDARSFAQGDDRTYRCRSCGTRVRSRPEDRRNGYCFDCRDVLETRAAYGPS